MKLGDKLTWSEGQERIVIAFADFEYSKPWQLVLLMDPGANGLGAGVETYTVYWIRQDTLDSVLGWSFKPVARSDRLHEALDEYRDAYGDDVERA